MFQERDVCGDDRVAAGLQPALAGGQHAFATPRVLLILNLIRANKQQRLIVRNSKALSFVKLNHTIYWKITLH